MDLLSGIDCNIAVSDEHDFFIFFEGNKIVKELSISKSMKQSKIVLYLKKLTYRKTSIWCE